MKIAACVKYSLDVSEVKVDPSSKQLHLSGVPRKLGNIDKNVLEAAATLSETYGGTVHIVSFGPPQAKDALTEALAMGAHEATLVLDPFDGELDAGATVEVLVTALQKLGGFDIIICGEASDDGFTYQIGPFLAEKLGWPQVTYVRSVAVEHGFVLAERDLGESTERVKAPLPALITVTEESNIPRLPTLVDFLKARRKSITEWHLETDLRLSAQTLWDASHLQLLDTKGIVVERKEVVLDGKPAGDLVNALVELLLQENVLEW